MKTLIHKITLSLGMVLMLGIYQTLFAGGIINISTRANISGGRNDVFAGFVIEGTAPKRVIIRGISVDEGVDPSILVLNHFSKAEMGRNDNWQTNPNVAEIEALASNLQLRDSKDAGLLLNLKPGAYDVVLSSSGSTGLALVSVDDVQKESAEKIINISTRANISGGRNDVFAGFVIDGATRKRVIIRGISVDEGVDPTILVLNHFSKAEMGYNNNWQDNANAHEIESLASNLQLRHSTDAGLLLDLEPGVYDVVLSSEASSGLALVSVDGVAKLDIVDDPANSAIILVVSSMYKFATVFNPKGLAVDQYGNVYIQSQSMMGDGGLLKFNQNGEFLAQNNTLGNGEFRLVVDKVNGVIWAIETGGMLYIVDPNTLSAKPYLNLNDFLVSSRIPVYDILSKNMLPIAMPGPQYGDIAIKYAENGDFDLLISGQNTAGGTLFVSRLRFQNQSLEASILVASHPWPNPIVPPPFDTQSSGLAVSDNGTVLTTFTSNIDGGTTPFYLAAFDADFLSTGTNLPNFIPNFNSTRIYTTGMAASKSGDGFFVVTNRDDFRCSNGASILYVSSNLKNVACVVDLGYTKPNEIAVGPNDKVLYVAMYKNDLVIKINLE